MGIKRENTPRKKNTEYRCHNFGLGMTGMSTAQLF